MNKKFEEFINEIKGRLLAYEMDESCFDDYDDNDRQIMRRLREALHLPKQEKWIKDWHTENTPFDDECKNCPEFDDLTNWCNINGNCHLVEKPKQEKWIVHRTLRKKGIEIYVKHAYKEYTKKYLEPWKEDKTIVIYTNKKNEAQKIREENAIRVRDLLNKDRIGKRYLWVISKVEE